MSQKARTCRSHMLWSCVSSPGLVDSLFLCSVILVFPPSPSPQHPLLDTNKHGWVDCWQQRQTKSCVNTQPCTPPHHGPLIHWLMVAFSVVHPSTSHPSLLSPSVLTLSPFFFSPLAFYLALWSGGNAGLVATLPTHLYKYPQFFSPTTPNLLHLACHFIPIFMHPPLLL